VSRNRQQRRAIRWARYVNHYGHIPSVIVGGWAADRAIWDGLSYGRWRQVRRQAKHRFGERRTS
jgi:hypothetical protein